MKKLSYLLVLFVVSISLLACREDHTDPGYNGDPMVHFNKGVSLNEGVLIGTNYKDVTISYGTIKEISGNHQVNLVLDNAQSDAVDGVDYQIVKGTDELTSGELGGTFTIRILEPPMGVSKKLVFNLASNTLKNAVYDQTFTLTWALQCTIDSFIGATPGLNFEAKVQFFSNAMFPVEVIEGTVPNTIILKDYYAAGYDIVVNYDPASGRMFADKQETGYIHSQYGMTYMEIDDDANFPSSANFCTRVMTLRPYISVSAGYFDGDPATAGVQPMTDTFVGL